MTANSRDRLAAGILRAIAIVSLSTLIAWAAEGQFGGKWRGELKVTTPPPTTTPATNSPGGGGGRFGGGRFGGGFGGGSQKVSLNIKQSKENKISGNIIFGEGSDAFDVKNGKVEGNILTFKAGRSPQPTYEYKGEIKDGQLVLTRISDKPQEYVLTRK
jgi:hypothetical protein